MTAVPFMKSKPLPLLVCSSSFSSIHCWLALFNSLNAKKFSSVLFVFLVFFVIMSMDHMNLSINGQSQVPPGFRFHPTEEELLHYYLRKKVAFERIDLDVIREVDLNKLEPWDIQEKCKVGSTPQNDWYFFSHKDKKYPTGTRTNRATAAGFWKATGRDKIIYSGFRRIGLRKTLVFYKGRAPHGQKSDWIMHEYRLDESNTHDATVSNSMAESMAEDGWVVCRVFKKKNYQKALESPKASFSMDSSSNQIHNSRNDGVLDQILMHMGRTCKLENHDQSLNKLSERFMHLPRLESPTLPTFDQDRSFKACYQAIDEMLIDTPINQASNGCDNNDPVEDHEYSKTRLNDWATLDRLVASQLGQLNGQDQETSKHHLSCFGDPNMAFCSSPPHDRDHDHDAHLSYPYPRTSRSHHQSEVYSNENDLWSFTKSPSLSPSSSDPLCHLSV